MTARADSPGFIYRLSEPGTFYRQTGYVTVKPTTGHGQHCIIRAVCRAPRQPGARGHAFSFKGRPCIDCD